MLKIARKREKKVVQETITTQEYSVPRQTGSYDDDGYGDDNARTGLTHCLIFSCCVIHREDTPV